MFPPSAPVCQSGTFWKHETAVCSSEGQGTKKSPALRGFAPFAVRLSVTVLQYSPGLWLDEKGRQCCLPTLGRLQVDFMTGLKDLRHKKTQYI